MPHYKELNDADLRAEIEESEKAQLSYAKYFDREWREKEGQIWIDKLKAELASRSKKDI